MPSHPLDEMGSINYHAVEVEHRGIRRQLEDSNYHGSPNGGEEIDGRGRDVVEPHELKEAIVAMANNDGLNTEMNFGHERFENVARFHCLKVPNFLAYLQLF
jgi:hypothetical protein